MKGFKVTCLECGKETVFTESQDNHDINIFGGQEGSSAVFCNCENTVHID
ncbi:hypothetical protein AAXE64_07520 [Priestia megaterium]